MKAAHLVVLAITCLFAAGGNWLLLSNGSTAPAAAFAVTFLIFAGGFLLSAAVAAIDQRGEFRQEVVQLVRDGAASGVSVPELAASSGLSERDVLRILGVNANRTA